MKVTPAMVDAALKAWWCLEPGDSLEREYNNPYSLSKARDEMRAALEAALLVGEKEQSAKGDGK